jgi:glycosyltransferase involved in cell wall biosynthesis
LSQIDHPNCELIVVADAVSRPAIAKSRLADRIKTVACDVAKISVARNAGVGQAAGNIVAFIDDDAVPEPTWLSHLTSPFTNVSVTAASGFLRSRNGIAFQLRARLAVLKRKQGATGHPTPHVPRAQRLRRLLTYMVAGRLLPGDVSRLLQTFDAGWADGLTRPVSQHPTFDVPLPFLHFWMQIRPHKVVHARFWRGPKARAVVAQAVSDGHIVSLYILSLTGLFHRRVFDENGVCFQTAGQFGKSDRSDPWWSAWRAKRRIDHALLKLRAVREPKSAEYIHSHRNL